MPKRSSKFGQPGRCDIMIIANHYLTDLEHKDVPMRHHILGLQYTRSGYGRKIPTSYMVKLPGGKRWRRVYCCIFSNIGTCYVLDAKGNWTCID
jgi:hypothetical protein